MKSYRITLNKYTSLNISENELAGIDTTDEKKIKEILEEKLYHYFDFDDFSFEVIESGKENNNG